MSTQCELMFFPDVPVCILACAGPSNQSRHHLEYRAIMQEMSPTAFGKRHTHSFTPLRTLFFILCVPVT